VERRIVLNAIKNEEHVRELEAKLKI